MKNIVFALAAIFNLGVAFAADWGRYAETPPMPGYVHPMTLDNKTPPIVVQTPPAPVVQQPAPQPVRQQIPQLRAPRPDLPIQQFPQGGSYQCLPSGISCWAVAPPIKK